MVHIIFCFLEISDVIRRKVWPMVVAKRKNRENGRISKEEIKHHQYYNQVVLDVKRILKRFPPGKIKKCSLLTFRACG